MIALCMSALIGVFATMAVLWPLKGFVVAIMAAPFAGSFAAVIAATAIAILEDWHTQRRTMLEQHRRTAR